MINSGKKSASSARLDTLQEEAGSVVGNSLTGRHGKANSPHGSCVNGLTSTRSRQGSSSSNSASANGKMVGLGIARRPSDNLLLNMMTYEEPTSTSVTQNLVSGLSQPRKNFISKNDRPISNDSIATRTSELFSSTSSDVNSGHSSLDNENDGGSKTRPNDSSMESQTEEESDGAEDNSINDMVPPSQASTGNSLNQILTYNADDRSMLSRNSTITSQQSQRTRYFFANGAKAQSQISFVASNSNVSSPLKNLDNKGNFPQSYSQPHLPSASPLYGHSNSTSAILPTKTVLTPSQRYRLRKVQNESALRKSIRRKEKYYDEQEKSLEVQESDIDNLLIWNIPMASFSTNSFLTSSKPKAITKSESTSSLPTEARRSAYQQSVVSHSFLDTNDMPTSPIPGVNKTSDFQYMQQASKNISSVYEHSSLKLSRSKLNDRTKSADFLPMEFKTASDLGFEDLMLVSEDKLGVTSHSRPSWLPPKDPYEKRVHEEQINKTTSMASIEQLDKNKEAEARLIRDQTNEQKFVLLLDRGITRNSSLTSLKKIIWQTPLSAETRSQIYDEILQSEVKLITRKYIEKFDDIMSLLNKMDFPRSKEAEIEQLIEIGIKSKIAGKDGVSPDLLLMLKLKSISQQGLIPGDELLFHHFLLDQSFQSPAQVWEIVNLVQITCFNDLCKEKYDNKILNSRGVTANYLLRSDDFKDEFNSSSLNSSTWWNVLERVDHGLFVWIMDVIVVSNCQTYSKRPVVENNFNDKSWEHYRSKHVVTNYKILLSFILNILLNYHFGFNDLKGLSSLKDPCFCIPMPLDHLLDMGAINSMFIRKWLHYYKKF